MDVEMKLTLWLLGIALFSLLIAEVVHWFEGGKTIKGWAIESKKAWLDAIDKARK